MSLDDRLNQIIARLEEPSFLANQGIGNEIGFYVFDYPPEDEIKVREHVALIRRHFEKAGTIRIVEINLFDVLLDILKGKKVIDKVLLSEKQWSLQQLHSKLAPVVNKDAVVNRIVELAGPDHDLVFLTGIGSAYPLVRAHEVLNNLHDKKLLADKPLVMFYPGKYTMQELVLFGQLEANYYRAFRLVPDARTT
jgi:hypothetical protein